MLSPYFVFILTFNEIIIKKPGSFKINKLFFEFVNFSVYAC